MDFVEWMRSAGLSDKSAHSYLGAINGRLTKWALAHGLTTKQIIEIPDLAEFVSLSNQLKQTSEFKDRNATGNGMYAAALNNYQKYLQALGSRSVKPNEYGPHQQQVAKIEAESSEPFDPKGQEDARARVLREVVRRRGQQKFRKALITAYGGRCAITGCSVIPLLEAAHITPYMGPETNSITNGLLLRADLHTLWDLGLIAVEPKTWRVWVSPEISDPTYQALSGGPLMLPLHLAQWPSIATLEQQWHLAHTKLAAISSEI
ncbi:HNH endonuclease [Massilia aurea]|uniref:HNH endonuclease n=1 Tax=Massilia aurea TaxID=373040 RepID=UPI00161788A0|nr:HNH endonuclease [Massilia aurea]